MNSVCVFCGSNNGTSPIYNNETKILGNLIAKLKMTLVYGGGQVGLMGTLADAALAAGGSVIGVIPEALFDKELAHKHITKLHVVASMHERKQLMYSLSDGFIALPGGLGTFDELFEVLTWGQLGLHHKPCGLLNVDGYYDPLLTQLDKSVKAGFLNEESQNMLITHSSPHKLVQLMNQYKAPQFAKWITPEET